VLKNKKNMGNRILATRATGNIGKALMPFEKQRQQKFGLKSLPK